MTSIILLDKLLQEVTTQEIQIATCIIRQSLYCLIHFSKSLPWGLCIFVLVQNYGCWRHLSEDSELVYIVSVLPMTKTVGKKIEKLIGKFIWSFSVKIFIASFHQCVEGASEKGVVWD